MNNNINITCTKHVYTVWINNRIFLYQPIYYAKRIPVNITPQAYWYLYILNVLQQHGLLNFYTRSTKLAKF